MTEGSFKGVDGIKIFTRKWQPAGKPNAVVVISHGFNAHSGQYEWVAQQFVSKGLAVYALDHRGRGRSEGERFFVKKFADWTTDLATFIDMVKAREPGLPVFLLGHSAGGLIAASYLLSHPDAVRGVVLASPYFRRKLYVPPLKILAGKLVGRVLPSLPMKNALKPEQLTRDVRIQNATRSDPLYQQIATPRWFNESNAAQEIVLRRATEFVTPFLLLFGGADPIADPAGGRDFFEHATSKDKQHKVYDGLLHELFHEPEREAVFKDVVGWLDERARGASARAAGAR